MKRNLSRKLSLARTTVRTLSPPELAAAPGGLLFTLTIPIAISILRGGCNSDPQSDDGGCTTQTFSA